MQLSLITHKSSIIFRISIDFRPVFLSDEVLFDEEKARLEDDFNKAIAGTKAEMNAYIEANSIDSGDAKTNEELIAVIVAWYNAKMDQ